MTQDMPVQKKEAVKAAPIAPVKKQEGAKKKHGCLTGCLLFFVVLLLAIGTFVAMALNLPRKWGLTKSPAEKIFDVDQPDYHAAQDLRKAMEEKGIATKGMEVYVLQAKDGSGSAAYVVLDEGSGFAFSPSAGGDPFLGTLALLAKSEAAKNNGLREAAFEYKDKKGRTLVVMGAKTQDAADFADGKITREEFMGKVGGQADLKNIIDAQLEVLK